MAVILDLLAESIGQACKSAHPHAHRQILSFHKGSTDVPGVWVAADRGRAASNARCRAVSAFVQAGRHPVNLDQHAVVNVCAEGTSDGIHKDPMPVSGEMNPV